MSMKYYSSSIAMPSLLSTLFSNRLVTLLATILTFSNCLLLAGCKNSINKNTYEEIDSLTKSRKLLNQGETDAAINAYNNILDMEPTNEVAKFELASAYASKSGINIYTLYPLLKMRLFNRPVISWGGDNYSSNPFRKYLEEIERFSDHSDRRAHNNRSEHSADDENELKSNYEKQLLLNALNTVWAIYEFIPYLAMLPLINEENRVYADRAIDILHNSHFSQRRNTEAKLYMSLLSAIQLGNLIKDQLSDLVSVNETVTLNKNGNENGNENGNGNENKIETRKEGPSEDKEAYQNYSFNVVMKRIFCNLDPKTLPTTIFPMLKYTDLFLEGIQDTKFINKDLEQARDILNESYTSLSTSKGTNWIKNYNQMKLYICKVK